MNEYRYVLTLSCGHEMASKWNWPLAATVRCSVCRDYSGVVSVNEAEPVGS